MPILLVSISKISLSELFILIKICTTAILLSLLMQFVFNAFKSQQKMKKAKEQYNNLSKQLYHKEKELKKKQFEIGKNRKEKKVAQERFEKILDANHQTIYEYNVLTGEIFYTDGILKSLGYNSDLIHSQQKWNDLIHEEDIDMVINKYNNLLKLTKAHYVCEYRIKSYDGNYIWIREKCTATVGQNNEITKIIRLFKDVDEIKHYEEEIQTILYHDSLTGLPNRRKLDEFIKADLQQISWPHRKKAFINMDIDNFKRINDTLGHSVGDKAIKMIGQRLGSLINKGINVFKLQGDEFLIYISNIYSIEETEQFAKKIINIIREPIQVEEGILHLTCSLGIATYPTDGVTLEQLLKYSDISMHRAKKNGKNSYSFFNLQHLNDLEEMMKVEKYLRHALENNEFVLHYQPKVNLDKMRVVGFEALIRWYSKELGFVSPVRFIKEAEATGLIVPIGEWVLREACRFIKNINSQTDEDVAISVNISVVQIMQENFVDVVLNILEEEEINPKWVRLELTETILITSTQIVNEKLQRLRAKGIAIALDDFGKEYSSLSYLKQLPLDILKIDKSFIDDIENNNGEDAIVDIVISLGKKMGFEIIAEGVETQGQLDYLYNHDCKNIQGYIFSKPLPQDEIFPMMKKISGL